jgi:DNA polymerase-3 subunit delta'
MQQRQDWLTELTSLLKSNRVERFARAETLAKDKELLQEILPVWVSFWRDVLLQAAQANTPLTNLDWQDQIEAAANRFGLEGARCTLVALERTLQFLSKNANPRLALEVLMLDLPHG